MTKMGRPRIYKDGDVITTHTGRRNIYVNGRPVRYSRYLMEQKLGRKLLSTEHVHHKDEDKTNDDPDNLEVLTKSEHSSLHAKQQHAEGNFGRATYTEDSTRWQRESMIATRKRKLW